MIEKIHSTSCGKIHYWINEKKGEDEVTLVFLPGLTADHHLFDKQIEYFQDKYQVLVWDAPGHAASRPFDLSFSLMGKAGWLDEILWEEKIAKPVIVGQSMGGYVGQTYVESHPGRLAGFISIDSAPLQRFYMTGIEIWMLKNVEWMYRMYPWKALLRDGSKGCATTPYGIQLMRDMMDTYTPDPKYYARLAGHGYGMLAKAVEAELPYKIDCPAILICGEKDAAGSAKSYNRKWHEKTGIPIHWIGDAGHNSNTDKPDEINELIEKFVQELNKE